MLSVSRIGSPGGAAAYYSKEDYAPGGSIDLEAPDAVTEVETADGVVTYYTVSEDELGTPLHWEGKGAELLGLDGPVDETEFKALLYGLNPDPEGDIVSKKEGTLRKEVNDPDQTQGIVEAKDCAPHAAGGDKEAEAKKAWSDLSLEERVGLAEASDARHAAGWDLTFSAPKSVSILALDRDGDQRLVDAHAAAVDASLEYVEKHFSVYRLRNEDGSRREEISGNLLMARTTHSLSRAGDPNLHDHVIVLNATKDKDGVWRALESQHIYQHMKLAGAIYQAELRNRVQEMGYDVKDGETLNTFTLADVPVAVVEAHSQRRSQIQANLAEMERVKGRGLTDAEREAAVLKDRPAKSRETAAELKSHWSAINSGLGFDSQAVVKLSLGDRIGEDRSFAQASAFRQAVEHLRDFVRGEAAVFERPEKALAYGEEAAFQATTVATPHDILFRAMIANGNRLRVGEYTDTGYFERPEFLKADRKVLAGVTTREIIDRERAINAHIEASKGRAFGHDPSLVAAQILSQTADLAIDLTKDQFRAVSTVLTSTDGVVALQGSAGTGKTTAFDTLQSTLATLSALTEMQSRLSTSARPVIFAASNKERAEQAHALRGVAPTHAAVKELTTNNMQAETLSALLARYQHAKDKAPAQLSKMRSELKGSWLLVDESSMMGNQQLETVFAMQSALKIDKVILAGDVRQIAALQAGAPFKMGMEHNPGMAKAALTTVLRQAANPSLKEVVVAFAAGRSGEAMKKLLPFIHELGAPASDEAIADKATLLWKASGGASKVVVDTNRIRGLVNARIRGELAGEGILKEQEFLQPTYQDAGVTGSDKLTTRLYATGQTLLFFASVGRIKAGETLSITGLNHKRNLISGTDRDGKTRTLDLGQRTKGKDLPFGVYRRTETSFAVGERVLFHKTDRTRRIRTNDEFEIIGFNDAAVSLRAAGGRGEAFQIPRADPQLQFMTYAYAVTADKAQGQSFQSVVGVLKSTGKGEFVNAARAYILSSRAKAEFHLVTDDFKSLMRKVTESDGINLVGLDNLPERSRLKNAKTSGRDMTSRPELGGVNGNLIDNSEKLHGSEVVASATYKTDGAKDIGDKTKAMEPAQPERTM